MFKMGKKFIFLGICLIGVSLGIFVVNIYYENMAYKNSLMALDSVKDKIDNQDYDISVTDLHDVLRLDVSGYDYMGIITIPKLNIELPIMADYDYDRLNIAPCRYYGSIYTNDLIICGHSYKNHFKYIGNLVQGDQIIITDISLNNYIYEVLEIEILNPDEVSKMIDNDFDLTLYTCTSDGLKRITVRCNRIYE